MSLSEGGGVEREGRKEREGAESRQNAEGTRRAPSGGGGSVQHPRRDLEAHRAGMIHADAVGRGLPAAATPELGVHLDAVPRVPGVPDGPNTSGVVSVSWGCIIWRGITRGWATA